MRTISLVLVVASMACYREAAPPPPAPVANKVTPRAEPRASRDVLAYFPIDSEVVVRIDFKAIRASAMWEQFRPKIDETIGAVLATLRERCGFDPIASIESFAFAVRSIENREGVGVIRGLDRDAYMACLTSAPERAGAGPVVDEHGIFTTKGMTGLTLYSAFTDRSTLVALRSGHASSDSLVAVLRGGAPLRRSPAFLAMFDRLPQDAAVWFLVNGNNSWLRRPGNPKLRGIYGSLTVDASATLMLHIVLDDAAEIPQLVADLDPAVKLARPQFDKLTMTSDGDMITVELQMSPAQVGRALGAFASVYYRRAYATP